ncbi:class I adenylate-forming enzyme family protein [Halopenitus sp. POP-27]|uniref:class I adenylate-forming enzyme family protein n=1 Tax=Halopenitus sp. POP-27 TaxID=2994425 RepID=UPI0024695DFC|nr:class I adenylate-forming enzyme family protein [Halopenitus sp. POP-27]
MITQSQLLQRNVRYRGDSVALQLLDGGEEWTYAEFDERVNRVASGLQQRGLREGDRVPIVLYNTPEFPLSVYACYRIGAIPVPLNYMFSAADFEYVIDDLNAEAIVYDHDDRETIRTAIENSGTSLRSIQVGGAPPQGETFKSVLDSGIDSEPSPVSPNDGRISYILYTSGTTGRPKGVVVSQASAYHRIQQAHTAQGHITQETVGLQLSPFFHAGGMGTMINPVLCAGGSLLLAKDWGPDMAPEAVSEHGVTYVVTVPTVAKRMADRNDIDEFDFSTVEVLHCMGSPLSKQLVTHLSKSLTPNIFNAYGSTESMYDLILRPEDLPEHAGKTGRPSAAKQVRIAKYDPKEGVSPEEETDVGEEGELLVKGEGLVDYYFNAHDATNRSFEDGWYRTKDLAVRDEAGYVTITGRADDMILSGGELVSPVEVEETLEGYDAVASAIVVGVPDEEWGQRVKAYVSGAGVTEDELDAYCKHDSDLADYKRPREYEFVESVKRTATGKKQRFKYRPD